jgi:hypothetical protein
MLLAMLPLLLLLRLYLCCCAREMALSRSRNARSSGERASSGRVSSAHSHDSSSPRRLQEKQHIMTR